MNWDIINKGNTSKDNFFLNLKMKNFLGQLFEEVIGSSLKNFNGKSKSPILIG